MKFTIPFPPVAQKRHRVSRWGGMYDPSLPDKQLIRLYLQTIKNELYIVDPPIGIEIISYMPIPKSLSNKKRDALDGTFHTKKVDIDNLEKIIYDTLTGICYSDDGGIAYSISAKIYSKEPRTEVRIWHAGKEKVNLPVCNCHDEDMDVDGS